MGQNFNAELVPSAGPGIFGRKERIAPILGLFNWIFEVISPLFR
jgi:hypothetical protein